MMRCLWEWVKSAFFVLVFAAVLFFALVGAVAVRDGQ